MSTILVSGATDGLGRALAAELRDRGHDIIVHGRSRERAEAVADEIGGAEVVLADFARLDDVRALARTASGVDVLVNNADDLMLERGYEGYDAYARSRLAQVMFTFELAQRRPDLVVNALHPATLMDTKMVRETFGRARSTVAEGVEATAALVERDDVSGRYFDGLRESRADPIAYDADARRRLWDASAELTSAPPLAR